MDKKLNFAKPNNLRANPKKHPHHRRKRPHVIGEYLNGYQRSGGVFVLKSPFVNTRQNPIGYFKKKES